MHTRRSVIITGAARRIGRAMAIFMAAKHGFDIVAHYNTSRADALSLQSIIQNKYGRKCVLFEADLCDFSSIAKLISSSFSAVQNCNVLINNASLFYENTLENCTESDFARDYNIHVRAPIFLTKYFASRCAPGGKIVNVIDSNITRNSTKYFTYLLSKKSLADFTELAASELALSSIHINAICPTKVYDGDMEHLESLDDVTKSARLCNFLEIIEDLISPSCTKNGEILHCTNA